ncbi:MAG: serpin family protein [Actinomycetota bacterium]|nr:serpin family protein [Actinomycetota bacterium]
MMGSRTAAALITASSVGLLAACGQTPADAPATGSTDLQISQVARAEPPAGARTDGAAVGIAAFGHDLLEQLPPGENVAISPASISTAFAMLRPGAGGATARQIDDVLHFPADGLGPAYNALTRGWETGEPISKSDPELAVANALWAQDGLPLEDDYLDAIKRDFGAGVATVDFTGPSAEDQINNWVKEQTRDRIDKLFDELAPDTKLVLANAVYLKATWETEFDPDETYDTAFFVDGGGPVQAATMHSNAAYDFARGEGWSAVRLPYAASDLSMWLLLADSEQAASPVDLLDPEVLAQARDRAAMQDVQLSLPTWDFQSDLPLADTLQEMGIRQAFAQSADFSALSSTPLSVSDVVHRADITVDEEGTQAAAVTGIAMDESAAPAPTGVEMTLDRPFAFAIVDETTDTPLFEGVVHDPTA